LKYINTVIMSAKRNLFLSNEARLLTLSKEAHDCLTQNILPFWLKNMQDKKRGGWFGRMTGRGRIEKDAPRGAILYARLLWTFSAAYRVLGGKELLDAATMTKATGHRGWHRVGHSPLSGPFPSSVHTSRPVLRQAYC
jgi:hypothetical protein